MKLLIPEQVESRVLIEILVAYSVGQQQPVCPMTFYFQNQESLAAGIRRIADEQIEKALFQLTGVVHLDPSEAIHDVRKRLKKIRALLRLIRDEIGDDVYQRENACFRDIGRRLSDVRDAQVRVETLDELSQYFGDAIAPDAFTNIRQAMEHYHQSTRHYLLEEEDAIADVLPNLKLAQERLADWPLKHDGWEAIDSGLKRVYKRGYKRMAVVLHEPTVEYLHDWRKRVKYLRHQIQLLRQLWPSYLNDYEEYLHDLTDYLGDDHDLAALSQFLCSQPQRIQDSENLEVLLALIKQRQQELQTAAKQLGQKVYAEEPKAFMSRFETYWQLWRSDYPVVSLLKT